MIWQNPWAWLGLVAIGLPIFIHLLGRGRARVERFPSLRFLSASRLLPTRRTRVHDPLLLAVRVATLVLAVAALAQPLLLTAGRSSARNAQIVSVIVVDTSTSMQRWTPTGQRAVDAARAMAKQLSDSSSASVTIETSSPRGAIAGAADWLGRRAERTALVILSDFQAGTIAEGDFAPVAKMTGVTLTRIPIVRDTSPIEMHATVGGTDVVARTTVTASGTSVVWAASATRQARPITILSGPGETDAVGAAIRAAGTLATPGRIDTTLSIAVVFPGYPGASALRGGASMPSRDWMTDVVGRLREDPLLTSAAGAANLRADSIAHGWIVVARTETGQPAIVAAQDSVGGGRLLLFSLADAGSLTSAALIAAVDHARSLTVPVSELEPEVIDDARLQSWQRRPALEAPRRRGQGNDASDGRWIWLGVLLLLGVETWLRRTRANVVVLPAQSMAHDRVA